MGFWLTRVLFPVLLTARSIQDEPVNFQEANGLSTTVQDPQEDPTSDPARGFQGLALQEASASPSAQDEDDAGVQGLRPLLPDRGIPAELLAQLRDTIDQLRRRVVHLTIHRNVASEELDHQVVFANGFLIDNSGYVMTHDAVLLSADRVIARLVSMPELRARRAYVVGTDADASVGLLALGEIQVEDLEVVPVLDAPDPPRQGQVVVTFGSHETHDPWASVGRVETQLTNMNFGGRSYPELWRISVEMRQVNPGGVVVQDGRVAGMVVSHWNPSPEGPGVGLVVPMQRVQQGLARLLKQAENEGVVIPEGTDPWIGLSCTEIVDPALRWHLGIDTGVIVYDVIHEGPAAVAGLDRHDVLVSWNGETILNMPHFHELVKGGSRGQEVELEVVQRGLKRLVQLTLGSW